MKRRSNTSVYKIAVELEELIRESVNSQDMATIEAICEETHICEIAYAITRAKMLESEEKLASAEEFFSVIRNNALDVFEETEEA